MWGLFLSALLGVLIAILGVGVGVGLSAVVRLWQERER